MITMVVHSGEGGLKAVNRLEDVMDHVKQRVLPDGMETP
jgi:hypothetical protein